MDASDLHISAGLIDEHLLQAGVKESHIRSARKLAEEAGISIPAALREMGSASSEQLARAIAAEAKLDYISFVDLLSADFSSVRDIKVTAPLKGLPLSLDDKGTLRLAVPDNETDIDSEFTGYKYTLVIASTRALRHAYRRIFANTEKVYRDLINEAKAHKDKRGDAGFNYQRVMVALLRHACYAGASDLHLFKLSSYGCVKLFVDGVGFVFDVFSEHTLGRLMQAAMAMTGGNEQNLQKEIFNDSAFVETNMSDDVVKRDFTELKEEYDFRLNFGNARSGMTLTVRFLGRDAETQEFDQLGFTDQDKKIIRRAMNSSSGTIVITGPTGSSKTTTRYAMLSLVDAEGKSIQTAEKPVEYTNPMWFQYEPKSSENEELAIETIFKGMLRNAPRVVDIAEVRSSGTAKTMMRAAATGHLVVTTMHADDTTTAIYVLREFELDHQDLATNLQIVIAVRLVRRVCVHCRVPERDDERLDIGAEYAADAGIVFDREKNSIFAGASMGCVHCLNGYRGRFMIYELLEATQSVTDLLGRGASVSEIRKEAIKKGESLRDRGWKAVLDGKTTIEELERVLPRKRY
jgi:type II secretory ATPase GspE/PulE/Tfp pilus assembly ATPase PilB-like protein